MFIIDFRVTNNTQYRFSVIGNANVDKVHLFSRFVEYASDCSIYLKVRSNDDRYVDKIAIASEDVSVVDGALVCKWTMGAVSTQCKELLLQLQFEKEDGEIIAQSQIVKLTLADTINVDELIPVIYPQVLKELKDRIEDLEAESFAGVSMSYANDTLSIVFKNKDNETLTSVQVEIKTSDKLPMLAVADYLEKTIEEMPETCLINQGIYVGLFHKKQAGVNNYQCMLWEYDGYYTSAIQKTKTFEYFLEHATKTQNIFTIKVDDTALPIEHNVVNITLSDRAKIISINAQKTIQEVYELSLGKPFIWSERNAITLITFNSDTEKYKIEYWSDYGHGVSNNNDGDLSLESVIDDGMEIKHYIDDLSDQDIYGNKSFSENITIPQTPTANGHATSKYYVDNLVSSILRDSYKPVDTTIYPTLNDFLASTGEEGYMYLYPIDTSDLTKGYYRYIWENGAWVDLGTTQMDLTPYYRKDGSLLPTTTNTYDLGSSTYTFKDLYLGGSICLDGSATQYIKHGNTNYIGFSSSAIYVNKKLSTDTIEPQTDNASNLGSSSKKWKNFYLAGNLSDGTNSYTIAHAYKILDGVTNSTALSFETILEASVSADTSYTFPVISAGTQPEAKAIITNSGASTITLTFENVSKCLCNDDNAVITSTENALTHIWTTTITMGAGVTYEISIVKRKMVVVNFEAQ